MTGKPNHMADKPNPWDRPIKNRNTVTNPTCTPNQLSSYVGTALSEWANVEHELSRLFSSLFPPEYARASYLMFGSQPTTTARIRCLVVFAEAFLHERRMMETWAYLKAVIGLIEKLAARRNDIAHGITQLDTYNRAVLVEPFFNKTHTQLIKETGGYSFDGRHIADYSNRFKELYIEMGVCLTMISVSLGRAPSASLKPLSDTHLSRYLEPHRTALQKKLTT